MQVRHSSQVRAVELDPRIYEVLLTVQVRELKEYVSHVSLPRHAAAQPHENGLVRKHVAALLRLWDYDVQVRGQYFNLLAGPEDLPQEPCILIGAHYDSVPETPGADDNASGLAVMLACARILRLFPPPVPVLFAAFNAEEDGALGSEELVASIVDARQIHIKQAHILEMVGYCSRPKQRPVRNRPQASRARSCSGTRATSSDCWPTGTLARCWRGCCASLAPTSRTFPWWGWTWHRRWRISCRPCCGAIMVPSWRANSPGPAVDRYGGISQSPLPSTGRHPGYAGLYLHEPGAAAVAGMRPAWRSPISGFIKSSYIPGAGDWEPRRAQYRALEWSMLATDDSRVGSGPSAWFVSPPGAPGLRHPLPSP